MDKSLAAHTSVLCSLLSPCKDYAAFGTNFGSLCIISLKTLVDNPTSNISSLLHLNIPCRHSVLCLLSKNDYIWIGVSGCVLATSWSDVKSKKIGLKTIQFPPIQSAFEVPSVMYFLEFNHIGQFAHIIG